MRFEKVSGYMYVTTEVQQQVTHSPVLQLAAHQRPSAVSPAPPVALPGPTAPC